MNTKTIIAVIIVILVIGGLYYGWHKYTQHQAMMKVEQMNAQSQKNASPSAASPSMAMDKMQNMAKNEVTIQNFAFSPAKLTVKVGDKVTWTNKDSAGHSATADNNSFDTGVLANGQSGSTTFTKAGTYAYHCSVHPNMKATIVVQ